MTAEEVTAKNPTSYTAGSNSIYGPSLNQEQLKAVAQATADFVTNNITEGMSNDQKIRAGYDYIKNNVTYVDWDKAVGANTAYGGLVTRQAACSGMTRGFIALMEAVDVKAYWIHATGNDHQWNMVEFNDGFYFIENLFTKQQHIRMPMTLQHIRQSGPILGQILLAHLL